MVKPATTLKNIDNMIEAMPDDYIALGIADGLAERTMELRDTWFDPAAPNERRINTYRRLGLYAEAAAEMNADGDPESFAWARIIRDEIKTVQSTKTAGLLGLLVDPKTLGEVEKLRRSVGPYINLPPSRDWEGRDFAAAVLLDAVKIDLLEEPSQPDYSQA